jgi:hypothetical protein
VDDLVQWLGQQLDEDERTARGTGQPSTSWQNVDMDGELRDDLNAGTVAYVPRGETRAHIAAWDPARVLREINAKRQALAHYARVCQLTKDGDEAYLLAEGVAAKQIQIMATAYCYRPGYREEWRP